jgi:hypothetical protein
MCRDATTPRHGDETMPAIQTETRVAFDADEDLFLLYDRDGDVVDGYETEEEALTAKADQDQADRDADQAELVSELQGEIQALADGCDDVELLLKVRAMLGG